jgi:hypothetical protein
LADQVVVLPVLQVVALQVVALQVVVFQLRLITVSLLAHLLVGLELQTQVKAPRQQVLVQLRQQVRQAAYLLRLTIRPSGISGRL